MATVRRSRIARGTHRSINFPLAVKDGWPPVAIECLPFEVVVGGFKLLAPPLFVKKLSVNDVIAARVRSDRVSSWTHKRRSKYSTVWLLRTRGSQADIKRVLKKFRALGCMTASVETLGVHAISVPPEISVQSLDAMLAALDSAKVAIAYPSFRHRA